MPDTSFVTGFGGDVTISEATAGLPVVQWSGQFPATIQRYVNSKSGNHPVRASTVTDATCTVTIDWNEADQPFLPSQGTLVAGTIISSIFLKISAASNDGWALTRMIVMDTPQDVVIDGKVMTRLSLGISGGTITPPGVGNSAY